MSQLESLETVATLRLFPHHVYDLIYELGALGVVTLGPVVAGPGLAVHDVVGPEDAAILASPDGFRDAGLEVHQHGPGHVGAAGRLVVVDVDPLQLQLLVIPVPGACGVDTMLLTL